MIFTPDSLNDVYTYIPFMIEIMVFAREHFHSTRLGLRVDPSHGDFLPALQFIRCPTDFHQWTVMKK
jgi:hypothetical protein